MNSCAQSACKPETRRDPAQEVAQKKEELRSKKAELCKQKQQLREKKREMKTLKKEMKQLKREAKKVVQQTEEPFASCVVGHLDTEERSVQKAGSCVLHQWKVKNIGTQTWVGDVLAVFNKGNETLVADGFEVLDVGEVQPGHVCYLPVMLNVPTLPGTYTVVYRMTNGSMKFGEPLRVVIEVEDDSPPNYEEIVSEPSAPLSAVPGSIPKTISDVPEFVEPEPEAEEEVEAAPAEPFAHAAELEQLKGMGFVMDEDVLKSVLVATKGDIGQAISLLM